MKTPTRSTVFWASLFDLLSSMRFAIGLLTILAIASVIGTVLQQNQPYPNYVIEFGQFWFTVFEWLGLFDVYHSMVMEEEMEEVLGGRMHRVGHVQIAQAPDRNEPDPRSGEWPNVIARLQRLGYNGAIGLEYKPSLPAAASVARAREATGLSC